MLFNRIQRRFASQESNPIIKRLELYDPRIPFDRNAQRTWVQQFYAPHEGWSMWNHRAPYTIQGLRMKKYLDGYFNGKALIAHPQIYRTMAGNLVRLFVFNPNRIDFKYDSIRDAMERIFGRFQGPGTSGRSRDDNRVQGRVKVELDIIDLSSPLLNAEILAQYAAGLLAKGNGASNIFDRIGNCIEDGVPKRACEPGVNGLKVAGFRLRIKGRPRGEEMAVKHDFMKGSCPKQSDDAWIDYGKHAILLRSGLVGVKAWVHFQRPHREDELLDADEGMTDHHSQLLAIDRDYNNSDLSADEQRDESDFNSSAKGLWNVSRADDPLVGDLVKKLRRLHTPDNPAFSRFIW